MAVATDLTPLEIFGVAIKSEVEAARLYQYMADRVVNRDLRGRLLFLVGEEKKHRRILEAVYAHQFPTVPLSLPARSLVPTIEPAMKEDAPIPDLFRLAMQAERLSEEFYNDLVARAPEENSRATLAYLARMEHVHYDLLRGELDLVERFPNYYQAENFELGSEMINLGP